MSSFNSTVANALTTPVGAPSHPLAAVAATGAGRLSEKSLELTFCSQFAEVATFPFPWRRRMVWFGLTQLQEKQLGFDAVTSLGGRAIVFQFKASNDVTLNRGRRFKVEHDQMQTLRSSFGHHPGTCFYVFPNIGNIAELMQAHSDVVGNSWLVDVSTLPSSIPPPNKINGGGVRKDNCHFAYLGNPAGGPVTFHSEPFKACAYQAKALARRLEFDERSMPTTDVIRVLKGMTKETYVRDRRFFRNTVLLVLPNA